MVPLNFPPCDFRFKSSENKHAIFDDIRKKFVALTPEEWVRQHALNFLVTQHGYPKSLINVEKSLLVNGLSRRFDIVVFNPDGSVHLLVECKAPSVSITQNVFDQIARYNMTMDAANLIKPALTSGELVWWRLVVAAPTTAGRMTLATTQ